MREKLLPWTDCHDRRPDEAMAAATIHRSSGRRRQSADGVRTAAVSQSRARDGEWKRDNDWHSQTDADDDMCHCQTDADGDKCHSQTDADDDMCHSQTDADDVA